jgi:hypothetical protein
MMPADDSMLSSGTVEFREEERRHRADDLGPAPWGNRIDRDPAECAECGHLHYFGPELGYGPCPICDCSGQADR